MPKHFRCTKKKNEFFKSQFFVSLICNICLKKNIMFIYFFVSSAIINKNCIVFCCFINHLSLTLIHSFIFCFVLTLIVDKLTTAFEQFNRKEKVKSETRNRWKNIIYLKNNIWFENVKNCLTDTAKFIAVSV